MKYIYFYLFLTFLYQTYGTTLTLGGLFNPYDQYGNVDISQVEHISAFLLAIKEINANSSFLPGVTLNYAIRSGFGTRGAVFATKELADASVSGVVCALPNAETEAAHLSFNDYVIAMADSVASEVDLGYGLKYKYALHTNPSDRFEALVIQNILCANEIKKVVIFAEEEETGKYLKLAEQVTSGKYCTFIQVVNLYTVYSYQTDFTQIITKAMASDVTFFIVFMEASVGAQFIAQGYRNSLFHQGTQVFGSNDILDASITSELNSYEIDTAFKGFMAPLFSPYYSVDTTNQGKIYFNSWKSQTNTNTICDLQDSTGYYFLYVNGSKSDHSCIGLNFSSYTSASMIGPYAAFTYDATYALAYGIQALLRSNTPINGSTMTTVIIDTVEFYGATGYIKFQKPNVKENYYGQGYRVGGFVYFVYNYHADVNHSFVPSKLWTPELGLVTCPSDIKCYSFSYNTQDNTFPNGYPPYAFATTPSVVRIAGLFSPYNDKGVASVDDMENLAAFLMAVEDINNKSDGLYDQILPNSTVKFEIITGPDFNSLVYNSESFIQGYFGTGTLGVVNAITDTNIVLTTNSLFTETNMLQVTSVVTDTSLGDSSQYPFNIQILPVDSYRGNVIQEILCHYYKYTKIGIFATDDTYGSRSTDQLKDGTYCQLQVLSQASFSVNTVDFSPYIDVALQGGATIYVLFMHDKNAGMLMEQGYNAGLFGVGTQLFGSTKIMVPTLFGWFNNPAIIPIVLKGFIGVAFWPDYSLTRTSQGKTFYKRWREQNYTGQYLSPVKTLECNSDMDDAAKTFLYRSQTNQSACYGLNFSSYSVNRPNINNYAAMTYDATITLLQGIHYAMENNFTLSAEEIKLATIENVNYNGVTGPVKLDAGSNGLVSYNVGDRDTGIYFQIKNFNEQAYIKTNGQDAFLQVLYWSTASGIADCTSDMDCIEASYNAIDGSGPASDTRPDIIVTLSPAMRDMLYFFGALVFFTAAGIAIFIYTHKESKLMKASQIPMMYFMLLGEIFAGARVIIAGLDITDQTCASGLWMGHLAFFFVFGCLFLKTWRIHRLVNSSLKRVKITIYDILKLLFCIESAIICYMFILTFVGQPHQSSLSSTSSNQTTEQIRCGLKYTDIQTVLFAIEGIIVIIGARLCWAVKDVPDAINESKYIAMAITTVLMISALAFPVVFLISLPPTSQQIVASISFAIAALATMAILFIPKIFIIIQNGGDMDGNMKMKPSTVVPSEGHTVGPGAIQGAFVRSTVAMKRMSHEERVILCKKQLEEWEALLMQQVEMNSSDLLKLSSSHPGSQLGSKVDSRVGSRVGSQNNSSNLDMNTPNIGLSGLNSVTSSSVGFGLNPNVNGGIPRSKQASSNQVFDTIEEDNTMPVPDYYESTQV